MNAFLSVAETARELGVSNDLVYDVVAEGLLPAIVFRGRKLIPRKAIDVLVERALDGFDPDAVLARLTGRPSETAVPSFDPNALLRGLARSSST